MHIRRILLIGAGELGSRHLQALAKIGTHAQIAVVDPSPEALATSQQRFAEVRGVVPGSRVTYSSSLDAVAGPVDLAIIATRADIRARVTRNLLEKHDVQFLVFEKVLFQKVEEYAEIASLLQNKGSVAWVNCPRRMLRCYQDIKQILRGDGTLLTLSVVGGEWGLASSAIHFIDLVAALTGSSSYEISFQGLDDVILPSKRPGFMEATGSIQGRFSNGSTFHLCSLRESNAPHVITISGPSCTFVVHEVGGIVEAYRKANNWALEQKHAEITYQSGLTNKVAEEIFAHGKCPLTPFAESCELHLPLINALGRFFRRRSFEHLGICPIT